MSSLTIEILEDVTAKVREMVPEAECRRAYIWETSPEKLKALGKPLVSVILDDRDAEGLTRGGMGENVFLVNIAVQKKVESFGNEELDPLVEIVERLFDAFLCMVRFSENGRKYFCSSPIHGDEAPICANRALWEDHCFFGMVQIEVKVYSK